MVTVFGRQRVNCSLLVRVAEVVGLEVEEEKEVVMAEEEEVKVEGGEVEEGSALSSSHLESPRRSLVVEVELMAELLVLFSLVLLVLV